MNNTIVSNQLSQSRNFSKELKKIWCILFVTKITPISMTWVHNCGLLEVLDIQKYLSVSCVLCITSVDLKCVQNLWQISSCPTFVKTHVCTSYLNQLNWSNFGFLKSRKCSINPNNWLFDWTFFYCFLISNQCLIFIFS